MLLDIKIEGLTPLMMDKFSNDLLEGKSNGSTNKGKELTPLEQAEKRLYKDQHGQVYWPAENLSRSIIDAGRFIKIGKRQLSTRDETIVPSFMSLVGLFYPIKSNEGWRIDARGIVNQVTKARVMAYRPIFDDWRIEFTVDLDTREGKPATVRDLIDRAGRAIGIGVMRPSRKGTLGQFKVTSWIEREEGETIRRVTSPSLPSRAEPNHPYPIHT